MPNYKGVEVPHILLTDEDVAVHASTQDPANAVVYADTSVEAAPVPADEPVLDGQTDDADPEPDAEGSESAEVTEAHPKKKSRRGRSGS